MRCRYCGQRIPEGELYCRHCGKEVRIVPDYNPLDDMLTAQIKGAIDGDEDIYNDSYTTRSTRNRNNRNAGRTAGAARNASGRNRNTSHSGGRQMSEKEKTCFITCPVFASDHSSGRCICLSDIVYRCSEQRKSGAWPE